MKIAPTHVYGVSIMIRKGFAFAVTYQACKSAPNKMSSFLCGFKISSFLFTKNISNGIYRSDRFFFGYNKSLLLLVIHTIFNFGRITVQLR